MNGTMNESMKTSPANSPENQNDTELKEHPIEKQHNSDVNSHTLNSDEKEVVDGNKNYSKQLKPEENSCSDKDLDQDKNGNKKYTEDSQTKISKIISEPNNHCTDSNLSTSETEETHLTNSTNNGENFIENESKVTIANVDESSKGSNEECSDEDSVKSAASKEEDAVSIHSDSVDYRSDTSEESANRTKRNERDIIILENDNRAESINGNSQSAGSPEIHEIISDNDNDDCVSIIDDKSSTNSDKVRHSNRGVKRRNYEEMENCDSESDIEEIAIEDPLNTNSKTIVINDTKDLVEMTAKKAKTNHNNNKREHTLVIIDTKSKNSTPKAKTTTSTTNISTNAQNLYQDIISIKARGTTITPISNKINTNIPIENSPHSPNSQAAILPSLTDDMFVVEAPSFIVPYVYEKPSLKPFKEFVTKLGQDLEQQQNKEKEERERIRKEKKEKGEPVSDSDEDLEKKKKSDKKKRRRGHNNDDDDSWDGESSVDSDDEIISDDDISTSKNKSADSIEIISEIPGAKNVKSDSYFNCSLGKFFIDIGTNLVQEFVQNDLLKQQTRKLNREKKSGRSTKAIESSITSLMKNLEFSKENNAPYIFSQKKCAFCSFKSESSLIMDHHLETPHMRNGLYKCNFCAFEIKSPHDILFHMEAEHKTRAKLERAPACHQCTNCPFEDNGKGKLARHQVSCAKKFKPEVNLAPPIEWEPPAKIPKIMKSRNISSKSALLHSQLSTSLNNALSFGNMISSGAVGTGARARGRAPRAAVPVGLIQMQGVPILRGGATVRPSSLISNLAVFKNNGKQKSTHQPSISITPLPRHPQPVLPPVTTQPTKGTFVICEICDGYIKDLEQLRNHMQWIHRVKIHPKMIYNRPPLNCQKCQFRFFTDQGLERHLLGSHGLVTNSMQEAANKGKDAGRCPVCGRVYQWKLLSHVAKDHGMTLKPAHLSYKCTVCTATFGMYKQFENHVYSAHSVKSIHTALIKKMPDKSRSPSATVAKPANDLPLKPLKINDEITITPQPVKAASSKDK